MRVRRVAPNDVDLKRAVFAGLDDPSPEVRYEAILGAASWRPAEMLRKVARGLQDANGTIRMASVDAIRAYGHAATQHLAVLRTMLANETRELNRKRIEAAIASLER